MKAEKIVFIVLFYVTVVGALNWGFHAAGYNLVEKLAGAVGGESAKTVENGIYYVVALCGLAAAVMYAMYLRDHSKDDDDKKQ
jgi:uncharacterized membrane protein YuzA (DUF378 family)